MATSSAYQEAVKVWVARRASHSKRHMVWAEDIVDVKFGEGNYGACETCDDPFYALVYTIERNGKKSTHYMALEDISPAQIVEECLAIYKTLTIANKEFMP